MADRIDGEGVVELFRSAVWAVSDLSSPIRENLRRGGGFHDVDARLERIAKEIKAKWIDARPIFGDAIQAYQVVPNAGAISQQITAWIGELSRVANWFEGQLRGRAIRDVLSDTDCDIWLPLEEKGIELVRFLDSQSKSSPFDLPIQVPKNDSEPMKSSRIESGACNEPTEPRHSDDYRSVNWFGTQYNFTPIQAACIKFLWEHWDRGTPSVGEHTILTKVESNQARLIYVFAHMGTRHPAWGTMIVPGATRGTFRLNPEAK